jgi:segregation and condensation protein B
VSAAPRRRRRDGEESLDVELAELPAAARWREWMLRVEAAIFATPWRN